MDIFPNELINKPFKANFL